VSAALTRVAIHGAPRSGTSWLGEIFNSSPRTIFRYQPLFSYALKGLLTPQSSLEEIDRFFRLLEITADSFMDQVERRASGALPLFAKEDPTHLVYKEVRYHHVLANLVRSDRELRLVAIIRNPLAVLASWLGTPREFRRDLGWVEREEWRCAPSKNQGRPEEFYGFEKWKEAAVIFTNLAQRHPDRVRIVTYHDLVSRTAPTVQALFDFCALPCSEQTRSFLERSRADQHPDPYSVFRIAASGDRWRSRVDPTITQEIVADLRGTELERYLDA
jgi:Sulfotransferase domain